MLVLTNPGHTAVTVMPSSARWARNDSLNPSTAALVVLYATMDFDGRYAAADATLMIVPPSPRSTIWAPNALLPEMTPRTLTPMMSSQFAEVVSKNRPAIPMPALFTRISTTPCSLKTCAARSFIADSSLTSAWYTPMNDLAAQVFNRSEEHT